MKTTRASQAARFILIASALLLPSVSLLPLGGLYLWEKGYLLWWALAASALVFAMFAWQRWLLATPEVEKIAPPEAGITNEPNPTWTEAEQSAWADVQGIAARVDPDKLTQWSDLSDVAHYIVNTVARRLHPTRQDALWQFTMPEALAITERVSQRLGRFIEDSIPFGDRLTVAQVMTVYSWRNAADLAEKVYDIWRIARLANPATAVTNEAREHLSKAMLAWGKEHVTRRVAQTFVLEVGRAAIDLYGGRLKVSREDILENRITTSSLVVSGTGGHGTPLTILVAGNAVGRIPRIATSLLRMRDARADDIAAFVRGDTNVSSAPTLPAIAVKSASERWQQKQQTSALLKDIRGVDIVFWIMNGNDVPDEDRLKALASASHAAVGTLPVVVPVIFISPAESGRDMTAFSIAVRSEYRGHVAEPIAIIADPADPTRDQKALWQAIVDAGTEASRGRFARELEEIRNRSNWPGAARQAAGAVRSLARSVIGRALGKSS